DSIAAYARVPQRTATPCSAAGTDPAKRDASQNSTTQAAARTAPTCSSLDSMNATESEFCIASTVMKLLDTYSEYTCARYTTATSAAIADDNSSHGQRRPRSAMRMQPAHSRLASPNSTNGVTSRATLRSASPGSRMPATANRTTT